MLRAGAPIGLLFLTICFCSFASETQLLYKKLAGPASEFTDFSQPSSYDAAQESRALMLPKVELKPFHLHEDLQFPVDPCSLMVVSMFFDTNQKKHLKLTFTDPTGKEVTPDKVLDDYLGINTGDFYPCNSYVFQKPSIGRWDVRVRWTLFNNNSASFVFMTTDVYLTVAFQALDDGSELKVWTAFKDEDLRLGRDITMEAMIPLPSGGMDNAGRPQASSQVVRDAEVTVVEPGGGSFTKSMNAGTNDGIFEAVFRPVSTGIYNALVRVNGKDWQGNEFARSLWYLFRVAEPSLNLTGSASASLYTHPITNADIITLDIGVKWDPSASPVYRGYAEVWGVLAENEKTEVPVAWVSGMVQVSKDSLANESSPYAVRFELDSRWLDVAKAKPPLQLRNLTFEESDGFVSLVYPATLPVTTANRRLYDFQPGPTVPDITYEMRNGFNHYRYNYSKDPTPGKIVLVHGYCTSDVPFTTEDFTDAAVFKDFGQSRSNDEFAQLIIEQMQSQGVTKFSTVSHSHGGIATLHMYTYYQTGMDATTVRYLVPCVCCMCSRQGCQYSVLKCSKI